jgi:hypothetical protein
MSSSTALTRIPLLAGIVTMFVVLLAPLTVIAILEDPEPELRIVSAWDRVTVLIADGDARVLVVSTTDREMARAMVGRVSRPWEPSPHLLISPADDGAAIGLWEILQRTGPGSVIVAGTPGADPLWHAIDRECRGRDIDLVYVAGRVAVATDRLLIEVSAPAPEVMGDRFVAVTRGSTRSVIALDSAVPDEPGNVLVTSGNGDAANADLVISTDRAPRSSGGSVVVVGPREVVRVSLESSTIRIFGGALRQPTGDPER